MGLVAAWQEAGFVCSYCVSLTSGRIQFLQFPAPFTLTGLGAVFIWLVPTRREHEGFYISEVLEAAKVTDWCGWPH